MVTENNELTIKNFTDKLLGVCGLTFSDFIYIQQGRERYHEIQKEMDLRDGFKESRYESFSR